MSERNETTDLPPFMTVRPFGWDDPLLRGAWAAFVQFTVSEDDALDAFEKATGRNIRATLRPRSGIERMVDEATGHKPKEELMGAFLDWATLNHWGVDEPVSNKTPKQKKREAWAELFDMLAKSRKGRSEAAAQLRATNRRIDKRKGRSRDE